MIVSDHGELGAGFQSRPASGCVLCPGTRALLSATSRARSVR